MDEITLCDHSNESLLQYYRMVLFVWRDLKNWKLSNLVPRAFPFFSCMFTLATARSKRVNNNSFSFLTCSQLLQVHKIQSWLHQSCPRQRVKKSSCYLTTQTNDVYDPLLLQFPQHSASRRISTFLGKCHPPILKFLSLIYSLVWG